jgi:membrane protease YdiL (CAAX protease family)
MKKHYVWLSPFIIIIPGFLVTLLLSRFLAGWTFIPLAIFYYTLILVIVRPTKEILLYFLKRPKGKPYHSLLAFIPVVPCIFSFILGMQYIQNPVLIALWILFAILTPFFEELFWRGYLIENLNWKPAISIIYSAVMFTASHPLLWGVFSIMNRSLIMIPPLLTMGIIWGYVYWKTKSLRYNIIAHFLVDLLICTVWVFLNIYLPPDFSKLNG